LLLLADVCHSTKGKLKSMPNLGLQKQKRSADTAQAMIAAGIPQLDALA
jgi:hypothetical protein